MKPVARQLLALLLLAVTPLLAQTPAPAPAPPPAKTWYVRLNPPRPTFAQDMTPAEGALMDQHFAYWKEQYAKGICVFGGPVLDPKGVYGVLAVDAATEDEARALGEGDPSVKAGMNHIEIAEMRAVFLHRAS